ncbi:hypothetical protein GQX74_004002 [Glossina fuscipes]|nr:hypothetical protein GQX74_004002 [Glossina fuscipes]
MMRFRPNSALVSSVISTILYLGSISPLLYCTKPSVISSKGRIIVPDTGELVSSSNFNLRIALWRPDDLLATAEVLLLSLSLLLLRLLLLYCIFTTLNNYYT